MSIIDEFGFVEPRVHAVFGQAGPFGESAHGVTVRVGVPQGDDMVEEDFEGAFVFGYGQSSRRKKVIGT